MKTTTTVMGDTWDTIALRVYGDTLRTQELMEARENVRLLDIQVFPGGVVVATPRLRTDTQREICRNGGNSPCYHAAQPSP